MTVCVFLNGFEIKAWFPLTLIATERTVGSFLIGCSLTPKQMQYCLNDQSKWLSDPVCFETLGYTKKIEAFEIEI